MKPKAVLLQLRRQIQRLSCLDSVLFSRVPEFADQNIRQNGTRPMSYVASSIDLHTDLQKVS